VLWGFKPLTALHDAFNGIHILNVRSWVASENYDVGLCANLEGLERWIRFIESVSGDKYTVAPINDRATFWDRGVGTSADGFNDGSADNYDGIVNRASSGASYYGCTEDGDRWTGSRGQVGRRTIATIAGG
jgi:hypothetical protein